MKGILIEYHFNIGEAKSILKDTFKNNIALEVIHPSSIKCKLNNGSAFNIDINNGLDFCFNISIRRKYTSLKADKEYKVPISDLQEILSHIKDILYKD